MSKMHAGKTIQVVAYSGYKANERPLRFTLEGRKLEVRQVLSRWTEEEADCFRVLAEDKKVYLLTWQRSLDRWRLVEDN
ncbi:MAG: hypothetical protein ABII06_16075 [Pseudomonadota bacterium]